MDQLLRVERKLAPIYSQALDCSTSDGVRCPPPPPPPLTLLPLPPPLALPSKLPEKRSSGLSSRLRTDGVPPPTSAPPPLALAPPAPSSLAGGDAAGAGAGGAGELPMRRRNSSRRARRRSCDGTALSGAAAPSRPVAEAAITIVSGGRCGGSKNEKGLEWLGAGEEREGRRQAIGVGRD